MNQPTENSKQETLKNRLIKIESNLENKNQEIEIKNQAITFYLKVAILQYKYIRKINYSIKN